MVIHNMLKYTILASGGFGLLETVSEPNIGQYTSDDAGVTVALLMAANLRLCGTHLPMTSELSQFVLAFLMAKRRMLEPLASVLREGFRKREQREIFEREIFERDVI